MRIDIIVWILTGAMIASIITMYLERDSFLIDGGYSVYKCMEIKK